MDGSGGAGPAIYRAHPGSERPTPHLQARRGPFFSLLRAASPPSLPSREILAGGAGLCNSPCSPGKPRPAGMDSGSSVRFGHQDVAAAGGVHPGNGAHPALPGAGMTMPAGMASLLVGRLGMQAPPGVVLPGGALTSAGYGGIMSSALRAAWSGAQQKQPPQPQQAVGGYRAHQHKGPWTEAEDV